MTWQQVHRLVSTVLAVAMLSTLPGIFISLSEGATPAPDWWGYLFAGLLVSVTVGVVVTAVRGSDPRYAARVLVLVTVVILATYPMVADRPPSAGVLPWMRVVVLTAVGATAVAFRPRGALVATGGIVVLRLVMQSQLGWQVPLGIKVDDTVFAMVLAVAAVVAVDAAYSSAQRVATARRATIQAFAQEAARRAEQREVLRWNSLVHDSVLSALSVAGRPHSHDDGSGAEEARRLAESALERLAEDQVPSDCTSHDLVTRLLEEVRDVTPSVEIHLEEGPLVISIPGDVCAALIDATLESVRNAVHHASPSSQLESAARPLVWVDGHCNADGVVVRVSDRGPGFNPARVPRDRLGLLVSVIGRMEAVEGSADVSSVPGTGTTVTLAWCTDPHRTEIPATSPPGCRHFVLDVGNADAEHTQRLIKATLVVGCLWLGLHAFLAIAGLSENRLPVASMAALGICLLAGVWGMRPLFNHPVEMTTAEAWGLCAVAGLVGLLVGPFVENEALGGFSNWAPGAVSLLIGVLVLRRRLPQAIIATALALGVIAIPFVVGPGQATTSALATITLLWVTPLAWFAAFLGSRLIFDHTDVAVTRFFETEGEAHVRAAEASSSMALAELRREELAHVAKPLLEQIASQRPITTDDFAAECRRAEHELRDSLRARALLGDEVRQAVVAARGRGVVVKLRDDRENQRGPLSKAIRAWVTTAIETVADGELTVRLPPYGPTLTLVALADGPVVSGLSTALSSAAERLDLRVHIDAGEGDLLAAVAEPGKEEAMTGGVSEPAQRGRPAGDIPVGAQPEPWGV